MDYQNTPNTPESIPKKYSVLKLILVFVTTVLILLVLIDIFVHLYVKPIPVIINPIPLEQNYDKYVFELPSKFEQSTQVNHTLILQFEDTLRELIQTPYGIQVILNNKNIPPLYITNSTFIYKLIDLNKTKNSSIDDLRPGVKLKIDYAIETGDYPKNYLKTIYILAFNEDT